MNEGSQDLFDSFKIPHHLNGKELDFFLQKQYQNIIGIDEVGRGSLAGPVVSCAIILNTEGIILKGLNDSKKLTNRARQQLFHKILSHSLYCGIGLATATEIDDINILEATKLSMYRAIYNLNLPTYTKTKHSTCLLVDGLYLPYSLDSFKLIKGDSKSPSIMAASIIAKVVRDQLMILYDKNLQYGFTKHKGYGTAHHKNCIEQKQYTSIHRRSFMPLKKILFPK